jgi:hypothetical protein
MVYRTQNYWGFVLFPSSSILENKIHDDSETVSVLMWRGEKTPTQLSPLEKLCKSDKLVQWLRLALSTGPNWVGVFSPPSPEDGNRSSFRNVAFLLPRTPNDGKVQKKQQFCEKWTWKWSRPVCKYSPRIRMEEMINAIETQSGYWFSRPKIESDNLFDAVCEIREPLWKFS